MMTSSKLNLFLGAALASLLTAGVPGCALEQDDVEIEQDVTPDAALTPKAWTGWTADDLAPVTCPAGRIARGADCDGSACEFLRLDCVSVSGLVLGESGWSDWFSEEDAAYRKCAADEWLTGIACDGGDCDNISIQCTRSVNAVANTGSWSAYYSEEDSYYRAPSGRYLRGVRCTGGDCDNMSYLHSSIRWD
ncbi:hypothetical protein WMF04_15615 [Sorangium sp. So ce260]|uniref:hypothetical protein n=1 Tax=Sorangium sp. So ce260 TaxID=3133291 RepID=UPI003F623535